jgi:hypothetical protein
MLSDPEALARLSELADVYEAARSAWHAIDRETDPTGDDDAWDAHDRAYVPLVRLLKQAGYLAGRQFVHRGVAYTFVFRFGLMEREETSRMSAENTTAPPIAATREASLIHSEPTSPAESPEPRKPERASTVRERVPAVATPRPASRVEQRAADHGALVDAIRRAGGQSIAPEIGGLSPTSATVVIRYGLPGIGSAPATAVSAPLLPAGFEPADVGAALLEAFEGDQLRTLVEVLTGGLGVPAPPQPVIAAVSGDRSEMTPPAGSKSPRPRKTYPESAAFVRQVRDRAGLTAGQLAERLGCPARRLRDLLSGVARPTPEQVEGLRRIEACGS